MQALGIGRQLALQLFALGGGIGILLSQCVQIGLGRQRCGIRLAQLAGKALVLLRGRSHLLLEIGFFLPGCVQRFRQLVLLGISILQLFVGCRQRLFVLLDGFLLKRQLLLEATELALRPGNGLFKIVHTRGGPPEFALGLLNLFVDGRKISGKNISVQRKRHNKVAQDFAHAVTTFGKY